MYTAVMGIVIFGLCVALFIWDRLPMATVAILGCALMVLTGVADFSSVFGQLASNTVIMLVGVMIMGAAISESGLAARISSLAVRFSDKGERAFIAVSFVVAFLLSTFLTNVTVLAIFIPIVFSLSKEKGGINPLNAVIPLVLAVNMGGITTLIGSSQQMTAQGLLIEYGYKGFSVLELAPFGLILGALALIYVLTVGYPLGKRIWGERSAEVGEDVGNVSAVIDKRKAITVSAIFAVSVFFYIAQGVPFTDISVPPHLTAVISALACIVTGCIGQKKAIEKVNWNIVGRLGGCLGLARALSVGGSIGLISDGLMRVFGADVSPFLMFAVIVLIAQVASLFISNSTAISLTLITVLAIAPALSLNVPAYAMGITLAASMGASCPLSGSTWGMSMAAGYKFSDYAKYGVLIDVIAYLAILITVPLFMGLSA